MHTYTVHEPSDGPADRLERGERLVFVRDGFSFTAAIFGPIWMIANQLWMALLIYLAVLIGLEAIVWAAGIAQQTESWLVLALHLLVGLESDAIRHWTLRRRGYAMIGSVSGHSRDECERRFIEPWLREQPYSAPHSFSPPPVARDARGTGGRLSILALRSSRT
jgi:hypothetical protein